MGYYSVLILTPKNKSRWDYRSERVYFGEVENMMRVKFFEAVRKAQQMPNAEYVVVWHDMEQMLKVRIEH
jgi:hypothetical protein